MLIANRSRIANSIYVLPAVLFVVFFFIVPLCMCVYMSLFNWTMFQGHRFLGLRNYFSLLTDAQLRKSLEFTLLYTVFITPVIFVAAFVLALMVNRRGMLLIGLYRTMYFLPVVIGLGTSSLIWIWLLDDRVGAMNAILISLKMIRDPVIWLGHTGLSLVSVAVSVLWKTVGFSMILILGGLQSISGELYESAKMDGCSSFTSLRRITIPLMRRTFAITLLLSVIGSLLAFDQFYIMTGGRPANSTITVVYWIYLNSFQKFHLGYGSAMSLVYLVALLGFCILQFRTFKYQED
jgi:multiple sugar transport system permease protein